MKRLFTFLLLFAFLCTTTFGQKYEKQNVDRNGNPTFVKFDTKAKTFSKTETKAVLSSMFNMTKNEEYKSVRSEKDQIGYSHERFQQYFKGIRVEYGVYIVHSRNGAIKSLGGDYKLIKDINTTPSLSSELATEKAYAFVNAQQYVTDNTDNAAPELVIVAHDYDKHP
ncbi:MAG: hypothetical protein PF485_08050, partial [Bacteroidales bacterium]|nr:hypothetical protein [Bacteroidales bacterium]